MAWYPNIVAIKKPYKKVEDFLDVLSIKETNVGFEKSTSTIENFTLASIFINAIV